MKLKGFFNSEVGNLKSPDTPLVDFSKLKKTQDMIEIMAVYKNGIFKITQNKWSKCYRFTDINYSTTTEEEQEKLFSLYCDFLNSMDVCFKVIIGNKCKNMEVLKDEVFLKQGSDGFNEYRKAYNNIIEEKVIEGRQGVEQERFLVVTVERSSYEEAKAQFNTIENNLKRSFHDLNSEITPLSGTERLHSLYEYYHLGSDDDFTFDEERIKKPGDFKNDLAPTGMKLEPMQFTLGEKHCRALFIKENGYPTGLSDRFITELAELPYHLLIGLDIIPIPKDVATALLNKKYLGIEADIIKQQEIRNRNNNFTSDISYSKKAEKQEMEDILDEVRENDANLFYMACNIVLFADGKDELKAVTETITTIAKRHGVTIANCMYQQREAFNSVLPVGVRQIRNTRSSLTQSVAAMLPFNVQEINGKNGIYYGNNQVSKNMIICDRKALLNGNGFVFGVPGSGKSFIEKFEMGQVFLKNNVDDIIIIDPMNEYADLCAAYGGTYINLSTYADRYVNPLDINLDELDIRDSKGIIREKGEFMLGLCEQCKGTPLEPKEKSIIDRCVRQLYLEIAREENKYIPVMSDFYDLLLQQPEEEAEDVALTLELFVTGSFNIFNHQTNVQTDNRLTVYGIRDLGTDLAPVAMLVMMEGIQNKIIENGHKGKATWLYIDEFHVLLNSEYSAKYLQQLWKKVRKQGGLCTGITQNVIDLLQSPISTTMLNNSEFVIVLKQSPKDMQEVAEAVGISDAQLRFVDNSAAGTGLIKWKKQVVPFDCKIDKQNEIYKLYNTNIHEKIAERKALEEKEAARRKRLGIMDEETDLHNIGNEEITPDIITESEVIKEKTDPGGESVETDTPEETTGSEQVIDTMKSEQAGKEVADEHGEEAGPTEETEDIETISEVESDNGQNETEIIPDSEASDTEDSMTESKTEEGLEEESEEKPKEDPDENNQEGSVDKLKGEAAVEAFNEAKTEEMTELSDDDSEKGSNEESTDDLLAEFNRLKESMLEIEKKLNKKPDEPKEELSGEAAFRKALKERIEKLRNNTETEA